MHHKEGTIVLDGKPIQNLRADQVVRLGVGLVPEGRRIFPVLTVDDNLEMGSYHRSDRAAVAKDRQHMYEIFPALKGREKQLAGSLSGGEQQMLAIARALMSNPRLLLMDEPSLGLAPTMVETVFRVIEEIRRQGVTVLMVEQNAALALRMADRAYVMESGRIALEGAA